jgi:predicted RNA polymerase sigma factor
MVALNHAVAVAMVDGPAAGLERVDKLAASAIAEDHRWYAVRAHLLEMAGDRAGALAAYEAAAARAASVPEQRYLNGRAAAVRDAGA